MVPVPNCPAPKRPVPKRQRRISGAESAAPKRNRPLISRDALGLILIGSTAFEKWFDKNSARSQCKRRDSARATVQETPKRFDDSLGACTPRDKSQAFDWSPPLILDSSPLFFYSLIKGRRGTETNTGQSPL